MALSITAEFTARDTHKYYDDPHHRVVFRAIALGIARTVDAIADNSGFDRDTVETAITDLLMAGEIYEVEKDRYKPIDPEPSVRIHITG